MFGNIVIRQVNGRTIISARPKKRDQPTAHQVKTKDRFMHAVDYARRGMAIPEIKGVYQKAVNKKITNAYTAALKDYLNAPVVRVIDASAYKGQPGDMINVEARDDFEVISLTVEIRDATGGLLEAGDAQMMDIKMNWWEYKVTVTNAQVAGSVIVASAKDRPGNVGVKEAAL
jgi:hypothetical protein